MKLFSTTEGENTELFLGLTLDVEGSWNELAGHVCWSWESKSSAVTLSSLRKFKSSSCERGLFSLWGWSSTYYIFLIFLGSWKGKLQMRGLSASVPSAAGSLSDLCTCFVAKQPRTFWRVHRSIISSASTNNPFVMRKYKAFECCELLEIKERSLGGHS